MGTNTTKLFAFFLLAGCNEEDKNNLDTGVG